MKYKSTKNDWPESLWETKNMFLLNCIKTIAKYIQLSLFLKCFVPFKLTQKENFKKVIHLHNILFIVNNYPMIRNKPIYHVED